MWDILFGLGVGGALGASGYLAVYLAGKWLDYADGHSESRLTDRLNDAIERELFDI